MFEAARSPFPSGALASAMRALGRRGNRDNLHERYDHPLMACALLASGIARLLTRPMYTELAALLWPAPVSPKADKETP